jgi:hypothetical protein
VWLVMSWVDYFCHHLFNNLVLYIPVDGLNVDGISQKLLKFHSIATFGMPVHTW